MEAERGRAPSLTLRSLPPDVLLRVANMLEGIHDRAAFSLALPPLGAALQQADALLEAESPGALYELGFALDAAFIRRYVNCGDATYLGCDRLLDRLAKAGRDVHSWGEAVEGAREALGLLMLPPGLVKVQAKAFAHRSPNASPTSDEPCRIVGLAVPPSLVSVGARAFFQCVTLESVVGLSRSLKSIGGSAFHGCSIGSLDLASSGVEEIGQHAFEGNKALAALALSPCIRKIGYQAFFRCSALDQHLRFPPTLREIGYLAFFGCSLRSVDLSSSSLTALGDGCFSSNKTLSSIALPHTLKEVGDCVFSGASLRHVDLSSTSVVKIGNDAFLGNRALASIRSPAHAQGHRPVRLQQLRPRGRRRLLHAPRGDRLRRLRLQPRAVVGDDGALASKVDREAFSNCPSLTQVIYAPGDRARRRGLPVAHGRPSRNRR